MQASVFDIYQRQLEAMQALTSASLSGFERAQQAAMSSAREMLRHQADVAGRVTQETATIAMDPERIKPALDGIMQAQRDVMAAVSETQQRCLKALTPDQVSSQDGAAWFDGVRKSVDQWQRWSEQMMTIAREQSDRLMSDASHRTREMTDAGTQAVRSSANTIQESTRRVEEAAQAGKRKGEQAHA